MTKPNKKVSTLLALGGVAAIVALVKRVLGGRHADSEHTLATA